ncbi:MAG: hypothetical protein N2D54_07305, partial [Chloroflexota bacterium]
MGEVYQHLINLLAPNGYFYIFQLAAQSAYQEIHGKYLKEHPNSTDQSPYMQYEESIAILDSLAVPYEVHELVFAHLITEDRKDLLEKYLRKVILDDTVNVLEFFAPLLEKYYLPESKQYQIPQNVNFIAV